MKYRYIIAAIAAAVLLAALVFIGNGYLNTRRTERKADELRAAVHAMTQQDLAAAVARCDAPQNPGEPRTGIMRRDAGYCEEVAREMDSRPLEIVERKLPVPAPR